MSDLCAISEPLYTVRKYGECEGDWTMVLEWWSAHTDARGIAEAILPPTGLIVEKDGEPVAALWCHLSVGVGIAFLEMPIAKPGLPLKITSKAMSVALAAMRRICLAHDYGMLIAHTLPPIARWMVRNEGFKKSGEMVQVVQLIKDHGN